MGKNGDAVTNESPQLYVGGSNPNAGITPGINPGASIDGSDKPKPASRMEFVCMAEQVKADGGYRRGFCHGVETAADLLWERMNEPTRKGIERISEIVLRLRFDGKIHPSFSDDVEAEFVRRQPRRKRKARRTGL